MVCLSRAFTVTHHQLRGRRSTRHLPQRVRYSSCLACFLPSFTRRNAASDPAQNPYWKRDVRRAYPQLSVVTQTELSTLLIEHHEAKNQAYVLVLDHSRSIVLISYFSVAAPATEGQEEKKDVSITPREPVDLTAAITTITEAGQVFSESKLPPSFPTSFKRWKVEQAEDPPHDPSSYFPMLLVK